MKQKFLPAILVIILMTFFSCQKDDNGSNSNGEKVSGTVTGRVFDENGQAVSGATVYAGDKSAVTDQWGIFLIQDALFDKERCIIKAEKNGYWQQTGAFHPSTSAAAYANLTLFSAATTHTFDASSGATLNLPNGAKVVFPSGAIATGSGAVYSGTVYATIHELPTDDSLFAYKIPGTDLRALNASNEEGVLLSYGMLGVVLEDASGAELNLKAGATAQITIPIAADQQSSAPASIALWYFDEAKGMWKEDGLATKSGNQYVGSVSHFTWWNCDVYGPMAHVSGYVVDCLGGTLSNAYVTSSSGGRGYTDGNGYFSGNIGAGVSTIQAEFGSLLGYYYWTLPITITTVAGQSMSLPNLQLDPIDCPTVLSGVIADCSNNPSSGMVYVTDEWDNLINYKYTSNGSYSMAVYDGNLKVYGIKDSLFGTTTTLVNLNQVAIADTLLMCGTTNTGNNFNLTLTDTTGTHTFNLDVQSCQVAPSSFTGGMDIIVSYLDTNTFNTGTITLNVQNYSVGMNNWTNYSLLGGLDMNGLFYSVSSLANPNGYVMLTSAPAIGGIVTGSFNGPVMLDFQGTLLLYSHASATFSITRTM